MARVHFTRRRPRGRAVLASIASLWPLRPARPSAPRLASLGVGRLGLVPFGLALLLLLLGFSVWCPLVRAKSDRQGFIDRGGGPTGCP